MKKINDSPLKKSGLKNTSQRLKILDIFNSSDERHLSAEDIYRTLIEEDQDIGLATVYRVLAQFEQAGLLNRHNFDSNKSVFELNEGTHHDHLICIDCGRVEEFYNEAIETLQEDIAKVKGFTVQEHSLQLYAKCNKENCQHRN